MNSVTVSFAMACSLVLVALPGQAQTSGPAKAAATNKPAANKPAASKPAAQMPPPADDAAPRTAGTSEPKVQVIVIEDDNARIDELRVRGQTQRIVVTPKRGGAGPFEIIPGDAARDLGDGTDTSRGAAGKRVWNVLKF
jgi:hypothetical protein